MLGKEEAGAIEWLASHPVDRSFLWPFQVEAIEAIEQSLMKGRWHMLVAMATGTGKTFTVVNLMYRVMKAGLAKRILFLVDRRALAAQAVMAMASFQEEPGLKFDQVYEVYSQRIRNEDLDDDMKFDLKLLPPIPRPFSNTWSIATTMSGPWKKAFMKVKSDRRFSEEQERWLELIRQHLTTNLLMEKEDIDYLPIFTREGASWARLNRTFGGELEAIINEINTAIAA
jgi:hypothetical protein